VVLFPCKQNVRVGCVLVLVVARSSAPRYFSSYVFLISLLSPLISISSPINYTDNPICMSAWQCCTGVGLRILIVKVEIDRQGPPASVRAIPQERIFSASAPPTATII
jgi:hypothetical protein